MFFKNDVIENFAKIHRDKPVPVPLFNKVAPLKPVTLLKKRLWHSCFPVNFATFLRTLFYRTPPLAASGLIECLDWAIVVGSHLKQPQKR